jgi:uncharacterized membrane protein
MGLPPVRLAAMGIQSPVKNQLSVGRHHAVLSRFSVAHIAGVGILTAFIASIYTVFSLVNYARFRVSSYDLVIFDQAIRSYAHFHPGISIIKGVHNGFGPNFTVLGDHFSPLLAILAPLYWIYNGPQTLLIAQAVLFALAIPSLWIFTRRAFGNNGWKATTAAYLVCAAYGLSWPLVEAVAFDFHEVAFAPLLTAIALERIQAGRLRSALIAMGALLLVKEDMGLLVAGIGLYLLVSLTPTLPKQRIVATALVVGGVAYTAFATYVLIPAFGGRADYYWAYSTLGNNVPQVILHIIRHPLSSFQTLFRPQEKSKTIKWLVAAFCFLPLLSPIALAGLPLLLERMLNSRFQTWWGIHYHYNAFLVVILVCAAVDTAARLDREATRVWAIMTARPKLDLQVPAAATPGASAPVTPAALADSPLAVADPAPAVPAPAAATASRAGAAGGRTIGAGVVGLALCFAVLAASVYAIPRFPLRRMVTAAFYDQSSRTRAAAAADNTVPSGVVVEAANDLGPELSSRDTVLLWDGEHPPLGSPWIVADVQRHEMTFANVTAQRARVALLLRSGYKIIFQSDGYVVLHRVGGPTAGANSQEAAE